MTSIRITPAQAPADLPLSMPASHEQRSGITLSSTCLWRDGQPWFPITGELHYSRVPREDWETAMRLMKAGGITVVASYIFWIHHQPDRDQAPHFDGQYDLAAFIETAQKVGLEVLLRVGPWCHGEVRNGGLPDWVVAADYVERTDDPAYLDDVRPWFATIAEQVRPFMGEDSPVVAVQVENELYDQPDHIVTLKQLCREVGIWAPIWTATAWAADLPQAEVFPMYGGYADGFWVDGSAPWIESGFAQHFIFATSWDQTEIAQDAADTGPAARTAQTDHFPPATCELGGGMASSYHHRVALAGADTAALALTKLGSGSIWQGYYMYVGGTNPRPQLQESHLTHYQNDLPEWNYDFGAPIGAHLQVRDTLQLLGLQHSFLAAFGQQLALLPTTVRAASDPIGWAFRGTEQGGFLFINTQRPFDPLPAATVQFSCELASGTVDLDPVTVPSGHSLIWPVELRLGNTKVRWATASVVTVLDGDEPVLVLLAADDIEVKIGLASGHHLELLDGDRLEGTDDAPVAVLTPSRTARRLSCAEGAVQLLVLPADDRLRLWTPTVNGQRRLAISDAAVLPDAAGTGLVAYTEQSVAVTLWSPAAEVHHQVEAVQAAAQVSIEQVTEASQPGPWSFFGPGRATAPIGEDFDRSAASFRVTVRGDLPEGSRPLLRLDLVGDIARARVGESVEDVFWNGTAWDIALPTGSGEWVVEVDILPLGPDSPVHLPPAAEQLRDSLEGPTAQLRSAEVITRTEQSLDQGTQVPQ